MKKRISASSKSAYFNMNSESRDTNSTDEYLLQERPAPANSYRPRSRSFLKLLSPFVLLSIVFILFIAFSPSDSDSKKLSKMSHSTRSDDRVILPDHLKPTHYDLNLTPDLDKLSFSGTVDIHIDVKNDTNTIVLHSNELKHTEASISYNDKSTNLPTSSFSSDAKDETISIPVPFTLKAGSKATIHINFSGELNNLMVGFYRSRYTDSNGKEKYMATTQFEPTDARRAFPCYDEPALKATFGVTLNVKKELTALSNMDVKSNVLNAQTGLHAVSFDNTPIMSTYLLAFIVGELEYIEAYTTGKHNGKPIRCRVYTPPGQKERGKFSLDVATKALEFFAESFGIAYPLTKLDQVAIPDFEAGAMENWGLVTYRTVALLVDEATSSTRAKQQVAATVCHELAHQWFGNLVTMEWWNELWLNEGFATWVGNLAVNHLFPEWQIWTQFLIDEYARALSLDSMRSSHPIMVPVRHSSEISQIFDNISYSKGASTIRMLSSYLGLEKFLKGIHIYLNRHKYKNASTNDLWTALSESSGRDVSKFMSLWTKNVGYPLLTVEDSADNKSIKITQNRYLSSGKATDEEDKTIWWVPVLLKSSVNNSTSDDIISERQSTITLSENFDSSKNSWYKLNSGTNAITRIKYSPKAIENLSAAVGRGELELNDRIGLVADTSALSFSGHMRSSDFLTLLKPFKNENSLIVWQEISARLETFISTWSGESSQVLESLYKLQRDLFTPIMSRLGWDPKPNEDSLDSRLRALAIRSLGFSKHQATIDEAKVRFDRYFNKGEPEALQADIRAIALALNVYFGGEKEYNTVKAHYMNTTLPMDQRLIALNALGSTEDPELVKKTLDFVMSEHVRNQDIYNGIILLSSHSKSRDMLWEWYKQSYDKLEEIYKAAMSSLGTMLKICAGEYSSFEMADKIEKFLSTKETSKFGRAMEQTLEKIRARASWLERDREDVNSWLSDNVE
ncbi:hypothetical protein BB561_003451 [Smittium simulii]|uniref:Aminopeptidase n=1 Tax=Smittium simulii TaxID=133385 RepID=A0A2T9YLA3_9FUNG|nr:hypothetical protein BB561_003451 [Smittium simulii]